jgi:uracil-DNA glycosylase
MGGLANLLREVRACRLCEAHLPLGPRPLLQASPAAKLLIAGQAPGARTHESGVPFDDASGRRLREWLGVNSEIFYDPQRIAILPMGFCYPGKGRSGDLPPRPECAPTWRNQLLRRLNKIELTVVIGRYAQDYHLPSSGKSLTDQVRSWQDGWPAIVVLPHPSPRNNRWLKKNHWFEAELLPALKARVRELLGSSG